MAHTATYSPDDNKLRLYPACRLDAEDYARVRAAGLIWAPKQELFVAPMWTPTREDLLVEMCGEIGDEDTSLVERAEDRAERFNDYSEKRTEDAERAREAVSAIAENIPFGQPILVGHHSEKHARKDAERIENGMRRAVKMWETANYWKSRAAGAIHAAKYKERPDVRTRRIKGLEADKRKQERDRSKCAAALKLWAIVHDPDKLKRKDGTPSTFKERALFVANGGMLYGLWSDLNTDKITPEEAQARAIKSLEGTISWCDRWTAHIENRLVYERAMLGEAGGTAADKTGPEVGGGCKCWASHRGGWSYIVKVNKVSVSVLDNWGNGGENFTRTIPFDKLSGIMTAAQVKEKREAGLLVESHDKTGFHLLDAPPDNRPTYKAPEPNEFDAMKETLKAGIQTVSAPQLFPTPPELAGRMVEMADIKPGHSVLEPSAGTGNLIKAMPNIRPNGYVVAIEINPGLCKILEPLADEIRQVDFLSLNGELGTFDRIVMNPPFINGQDIKHILHAKAHLKPGGKLVALCANGPRQRETLQPLADSWEDLPAGSFKEQGTSVNVALLVINN